MTLARRAILKLLGAAPAALPFASQAAPALLARADALAAAGVAVGAQVPGPANAAMGGFIGRQLGKLKHQMEQEQYHDHLMREGGIDPDIACIKSTSRSYKIARCRVRRREDVTVSMHINNLLWPGSPGT